MDTILEKARPEPGGFTNCQNAPAGSFERYVARELYYHMREALLQVGSRSDGGGASGRYSGDSGDSSSSGGDSGGSGGSGGLCGDEEAKGRADTAPDAPSEAEGEGRGCGNEGGENAARGEVEEKIEEVKDKEDTADGAGADANADCDGAGVEEAAGEAAREEADEELEAPPDAWLMHEDMVIKVGPTKQACNCWQSIVLAIPASSV